MSAGADTCCPTTAPPSGLTWLTYRADARTLTPMGDETRSAAAAALNAYAGVRGALGLPPRRRPVALGLDAIKAKHAAEARERAKIVRRMKSPRLAAIVERAKARGELVKLEMHWAMGPYTGDDPVELYLHAKLGIVVEKDGRTWVEPWAREAARVSAGARRGPR